MKLKRRIKVKNNYRVCTPMFSMLSQKLSFCCLADMSHHSTFVHEIMPFLSIINLPPIALPSHPLNVLVAYWGHAFALCMPFPFETHHMAIEKHNAEGTGPEEQSACNFPTPFIGYDCN